jgi:hypothetical protein
VLLGTTFADRVVTTLTEENMGKDIKERITITVSPETRLAISEMAEEQKRSFSNMTEILLLEGLLRYTKKEAA